MKPFTDVDVHWDCYRSPNTNLVYFSHNKCGSSLHYELFVNRLNWQETNTQEIDWDTDIVFSHIMDPLIKHRKGIVQGINFYKEVMHFIQNSDEGIRFLANITSIEPHSYTLQRMLGDNALKIHWIPLDTDVDHKLETATFIRKHNVTFTDDDLDWFRGIGKVHESDQYRLELFNKLIAVPTPIEILRYIDFDRCLYDKLTCAPGFEPKGYQQRVADLKQSGLTDSEAELKADAEVESGEYLNWNYKEQNC